MEPTSVVFSLALIVFRINRISYFDQRGILSRINRISISVVFPPSYPPLLGVLGFRIFNYLSSGVYYIGKRWKSISWYHGIFTLINKTVKVVHQCAIIY